MFDIDQVKGSKDIERTTLGLQTDRATYRQLQINIFKGSIKMQNHKVDKLMNEDTDSVS